MIEYQKKIMSYIDGSLPQDERAEFEAFVSIHPEFESQIKSKEDELSLLKTLIPAVRMSRKKTESLESEMRLSIKNLLKEEPKNFWDRVKTSLEDWISR